MRWMWEGMHRDKQDSDTEDFVCHAFTKSRLLFVNNKETVTLILIPNFLPSLKDRENQLTF